MTDRTRRYWLWFKHRVCYRVWCAVRRRHRWCLGIARGKHGEPLDSFCRDCGTWGTYAPHKRFLDNLKATDD